MVNPPRTEISLKQVENAKMLVQACQERESCINSFTAKQESDLNINATKY
ncbi:hypothetical protein SynBIOSU31_02057 [Synechococcus sp. BIOS-U3-1]|nr:hypothetical protein SynBIOSU31_02057 [Synechococcus sp. BIOS-U3-1]